MTKKELMEMLKDFDDNAVVVIATRQYDPRDGFPMGDLVKDIEQVKEDKEKIKLYFN